MARHEVFPLCSSIIQWHLSLLTTTVAVCSPQWITANIQKWMTLKCVPKYLSAVSFPMHSLHHSLPFSNRLPTPDWKVNRYQFSPSKTKLFSHFLLHFLLLLPMSFPYYFSSPVALPIYFLFCPSGSVFPVKANWSSPYDIHTHIMSMDTFL